MTSKTSNPAWTASAPGSRARAVGSRIRDRIFIVNTVLFLLLGCVILYRSIALGLTLLALMVGGGFVGLGAFRLAWLFRYRARNR